MYRVTLVNEGKENVIHRPGNSDIKINQGTIAKGLNTVNSFTFLINSYSSAFNIIKPRKTIVLVDNLKRNTREFEGYVLKRKYQMSEDGSVTSEILSVDEMNYLKEIKQRHGEFHNKTPEQFLKIILKSYNSRATQDKQFKLGIVEVSNSTDNVYRYIDPTQSTFDTIYDKLINRLGGELRIRKEKGIRYLDWLKENGEHKSTEIRIKKNLLSIEKDSDTVNVFTRLIPLGARIESEIEEATDASEARVTIESVNGGKDYLDDLNAQKKFGVIEETQVWDDIQDPKILYQRGQDFISGNKSIKDINVISALDLSVIDMEIDNFKVGNYYPIFNPLTGNAEELRIVEQHIDLLVPQRSNLTIGDRGMKASEYQVEILKTKKYAEKLKNIVSSQQDSLKSVYKELSQSASSIDQLNSVLNQLKERVDNLETGNSEVGKIIDVSEWQGVIDWDAVKADGVELAIIRVQHGSNHQDMKYAENIFKVREAGLKYAVYAYAGYVSDGDAQIEAQDFYDRTQKAVGAGEKPLFYMIDVEEQSATDMRTATQAWCAKMTALGVPSINQVAYIANHLYDSFNIDVAKFGSIVVPSYGTNDGTISGSVRPTHPYDLWQYTSAGSVAGIEGNVDMNTEASTRFKKQYLRK